MDRLGSHMHHRLVYKGSSDVKIYSVYDGKAEMYLPPFYQTADGAAIRMFQGAVNDQDHDFCKYAADYTLFAIGEWDEKSGTIFSAQQNLALGNGLTFQDSGSFEKALQTTTDNLQQEIQELRTKNNGVSPAATRWETPPENPDL